MGRLASADPAWEASAARLYRALLGPVSRELAEADTLLVVADGPLAQVPFAALTPGGGAPPLLERYRISSVPSFSVYLQVSGRPVPNVPPRVLAVREAGAVPEGASPPSLHVFDAPTLLEGREARRSRLLQEARRHTLLFFDVPMEPGEEAPLASRLLLASEPGRQGYLRAAEVASMTLPESQLVFLAAAGTGPGAAETARAAGALAGAFLVAGAPSVVTQRWQVEPEVREVLLLAFLSRMLEVGPVEALRQAQLALRARPGTAHPRHWGAFAHHGWGK
jgi:CHAT domain-containing protein